MKIINFKYISIGWLLIVSLLAACSKDDHEPVIIDESEPELEIVTEDHTFSFTSAGNAAQVLYFNTNRDWRVVLEEEEGADYSWLTVFERQGTPGDSVKVWVATAENEQPDGRRAHFRLEVGELSESFTVYQAQKDAVVITDPKAFEELSAEEQTIEVEFGINVGDYVVEIATDGKDGKWIELVTQTDPGTRALVNKKVKFKIAANAKFNVRRASITFKSKDNNDVKASMNIFQHGLPKPVMEIMNKEAFENLVAEKSSVELKLTTTNVSSLDELTIAIEQSDREWISFRMNDDETAFIIDVEENIAAGRSATIAVCAVADPTVKTEFEVSQIAADGVVILIKNKEDYRAAVSKLGGILSVKYEKFIDDWNVKVEYPVDQESVDWLHIRNTTSPNQVLLYCDENTTLKGRSAVVTLYQVSNEAKKDYVTIRQAPGTLIVVEGSLQATLDKLVADEIFEDVKSITSLELKGQLSDADWNLLKDMTHSTKGYSLKTLNLAEVTNTRMKENAFNNGKDMSILQSIVFPGNLEFVPANVCDGCSALTSARILEGVEYLDHHAFKNCTNLQEIWLPGTLTYIYGYCFEQCTRISKIHLRSKPVQIYQVVRSAPQQQTWATTFQGSLPKTATLYIFRDYVDYYKNPDPQHVASRHLGDYLKGLKANSPEWLEKTPAFDYKHGDILKNNFSWTNSATNIVAED